MAEALEQLLNILQETNQIMTDKRSNDNNNLGKQDRKYWTSRPDKRLMFLAVKQLYIKVCTDSQEGFRAGKSVISQSFFKLGPPYFAWKQIQIIPMDGANDDDNNNDDAKLKWA